MARVDDWDEAETAGLRPPPRPAVPAGAADSTAAEASAGAALPEAAEAPALPWHGVLRAAPAWTWLIGVVALGLICAMVFSVVFLMVLR